jgi:hypothetical protein
MADTYVISGLKARYARVLGEIRSLENRARKLKLDAVHLKSAIHLFAEELDVDAIEPIKPANARRWFGDGQCGRAVLDVLRTASEPMSVRDIAAEIMTRQGASTDDWRAVKAASWSVRDALKRRNGGLVVSSGTFPKLWALAQLDEDG